MGGVLVRRRMDGSSRGANAPVRVVLACLVMAGWLLAGCGSRETGGRTASAATVSASANGTTAGSFAAPAVASRGTAWLPPGAGDGDWSMPSRDYAGTRFSP